MDFRDGCAAGAGGALKSCRSVEKGGRRDLETLLTVEAAVPGLCGGACAADGVERFRLCAFTLPTDGAAAFRGAVDADEVGGDGEVESACIDSGRLEVAAVVAILLSLAVDAVSFFAVAEVLLAVDAILGLSVVTVLAVVALDAFLGLKLLPVGGGAFSLTPSSFDLAVAIVEILLDLVPLLKLIDLSTFFASSLSFRFLVPAVLRTAALSFVSLVGATGGGIREVSDSEGSLGSLSLLLCLDAIVLGLGRVNRDGDDGRREVGDEDGGSEVGATDEAALGGRFEGVGKPLGRGCRVEADEEEVFGVAGVGEGTGNGIIVGIVGLSRRSG